MSFDLFEEYSVEELLLFNIQFLGFNQHAWDYSRGARTERHYTCMIEPGVLKIRDYYKYTMTNGNRDVATIERFIEWYDLDGKPGLTKQIHKEHTIKSMAELNQKIRNGRITDLTANAAALPNGNQIVDPLYFWYGHLIESYIDRNDRGFEEALKNETDQQRLDLLNMPLIEFDGATIMQLLTFQLIGEYSWPE